MNLWEFFTTARFAREQKKPILTKEKMTDPLIVVNRFIFTDTTTIGELIVDKGIFKAHTLEDTCRRDKNNDGILQQGEKIYAQTAIPSGIYRLILANSPHFGFVPHLLNVPYFENVLLHPGNSSADSAGCLLVGKYHAPNESWIGESRVTFKALMDVLVPLNQKNELWMQINGGLRPEDLKIT